MALPLRRDLRRRKTSAPVLVAMLYVGAGVGRPDGYGRAGGVGAPLGIGVEGSGDGIDEGTADGFDVG